MNGSNVNQTISIPAGASGIGVFEDVSNSDTIASGNTLSISVTAGTGGSITVGVLSILFAATTDTVSKLGTSALNIPFATASVSRYNVLVSEISSGVGAEGSAQTMIRTAGTLRNLQVSVASNARTTPTDIRIRKNGANGNLAVTVSGPAPGVPIEDTTHTDTVAAGDLIDFVTVTGTGTENLNVSHIIVDFVTTDGKGFTCYGRAGAYAQPEPATNYPYIGGGAIVASTGTETNTQVKTRAAFTFSQMTMSVTQNTINATSTLRFRKNAGNGNQVISIGSTATGFLFDNTNTDDCNATDLVNLQLVTTDVTGTQTMTVRHFALVYSEITSVPVEQTSIQKYDILQNVSRISIHKYNLLQFVANTSVGKYDILKFALASSIHKYDSLQNVLRTSIHRYDSVAAVVATSIHKYDSRVFVLRSTIHKFDILAFVSRTSIHKYEIMNNVVQTVIHKYDRLQNVLATSIHKYNILQAFEVIAEYIHRYDILAYTSKTSVHKYDILQYISKEVKHKYNNLIFAISESIHKYDILTAFYVTMTSIHKYDMLTYVQKTSIHKYTIAKKVKKFVSMLGPGKTIEIDNAGKLLEKYLRDHWPE